MPSEKPEKPASMPGDDNKALASMGIYVFSTSYLRERLRKNAKDLSSNHDFGHDLIPHAIEYANAFAFPFMEGNTSASGYWKDVGTIDAYWEANINLAEINPDLDLYDENWPIGTHQLQLPPAKFTFDSDDRRGMAVDSLVSAGCLITGATVRHSVLFSNVRVHSYSIVEDAVILPGVIIGRRCRIKRCVIDKGTIIPDGMVVGENPEDDSKRFHVSENGIVLITPEMLGQKLHEV